MRDTVVKPHDRRSAEEILEVLRALSAPRLQRFITAKYGNRRRALMLYEWNATISSAFMLPLHICEVVLRNTIAGVIEHVYGAAWYTAGSGLESSLPRRTSRYSPFADLGRARLGRSAARDVIPELTFMFWNAMLTSRHDARLWNPHLKSAFRALPTQLPALAARSLLYGQVNAVRLFRNRIAHHEPIFTRDLHADYRRIRNIIFRCSPETARWLHSIQTVTGLLPREP